MKSYVVTGNGLPLEEVVCDKPTPRGKEVLIKTIACGVCHSDVHIHDGYFDIGNDKKMTSRLVQPLAMGHEIYGELVETGEDVRGVEVGKKYVVYPWIGCGDCKECKNDMEHYCGPFTAQNLGVSVNGGHAEYVLVKDARYLFDAGDTPEELAGSYACRGLTAYSALKKANLKSGQKNLVIIGAGGLGLLALKIAKAAFNIKPIVVDIDDQKLQAAKKAGAREVINSKNEGASEKIIDLTNGSAGAVIDFVGSESSVNFGYKLFGFSKGGQYILVGLLGGQFNLQLPLHTFTARTISGTYVGSLKEMGELMELVRSGKIDPVQVESRHISQATDTLRDLKNGDIPGMVCLKH